MEPEEKITKILEGLARGDLTTSEHKMLGEEFPERLEPIAAAIEDVAYAMKMREKLYTRQIMRTIRVLVDAAESKDPGTKGHSLRVSTLLAQLAAKMAKSEQETESLSLAALLHNIGNIAIPDAILLKEGPLTKKQFEIMKQHPVSAVEMLSDLEFLQDALPAIRYHHERFDGQGYLDGLKGREIPEGARMLAVVTTYDALTSKRAYRNAFSNDEACQILRNVSGTQLDPEIVEQFVELMNAPVSDETDRTTGASTMSGVNLA